MSGCGSDLDPQQTLEDILQESFTEMEKSEIDWEATTSGDFGGSRYSGLRRALREQWDDAVDLPSGYSWRSLEVDYATGIALRHLAEMFRLGYETEILDWADTAQPPTAKMRLHWQDARSRSWSMDLHLKKSATHWVLTEPFREPRRSR